MTKSAKHIGLFFLLLFCGSLLAHSAAFAYTFQQEDYIDQGNQTNCLLATHSGATLSVDSANEVPAEDEYLTNLPTETSTEDSQTGIVNNCNNNLFLSSDESIWWPTAFRQSSVLDFYTLLSSQVFVFKQPDPPKFI